LTIDLSPPAFLGANGASGISLVSPHQRGGSHVARELSIYLPEGFGEISPEYAEMPLEAVEDAYRSGSNRLRILLDELALHPDEPRPYSEVERRLEWSRGTIAATFGGYSNKSKRKYDRKRPFHLAGNEDDEYWIWVDPTRAERIKGSR
jgi:hypothetical protein